VATKAAAGLAAAAILTAGTVAVSGHEKPSHWHGLSATTIINRSIADGIEHAAPSGSGIAGAVPWAPSASVAADRSP
jgi:hypothetical protein